jgi:hypothetical protein
MIGNGTLIGLHQHKRPAPDGMFNEFKVGLDHVAFGCADRAELEKWALRLDELGITHGGIKDATYGSGVSFRDPDGIALEFFAPTQLAVRILPLSAASITSSPNFLTDDRIERWSDGHDLAPTVDGIALPVTHADSGPARYRTPPAISTGAPDALHRQALRQLITAGDLSLAARASSNIARSYRVDAYSERGQLDRGHPDEGLESCLRGDIAGQVRRRGVGRHRGDAHNRTTAAFDHSRAWSTSSRGTQTPR